MRTVIVPIRGYLNNKLKKLWDLAIFAKKRYLHLSSHEEVGAHVIALDARKRKLVYAKKSPNVSSCLIIDLNSLEACYIKKEYNSINAEELKTKKLHHFLKTVLLKLVFKDSPVTISLPLFDAQKEQHGNIEQLEKQAKKWEKLLLKTIDNSYEGKGLKRA